MTLWDIAIEEAAKKKDIDDDNQPSNSTIIIVGSKGVGKSTLLIRFLNKDEKPKPTIALEYAYGRQQRITSMIKDVGHLWELGGGIFLTTLLEIPININSLKKFAAIVMIDLSKPEELLVTLESLIKHLQTRIEEVLEKGDPSLREKLVTTARERIGIDHVDKDIINPFPVPLIILGGRYDVFQDFDPEQKKIICQTLRFLAHSHGAMLQFFSSKIEILVSKGKQLMSHLAFGSQFNSNVVHDYNKPLLIPFGSDTLENIEATGMSDGKEKKSSYAIWKNTFEARFLQISPETINPDDPAKDPNFFEPQIDTLRAHKDEELKRHQKESERRRKLKEKD